jgi:hypothetical protein
MLHVLPSECNMPDLSTLESQAAQGSFLLHQFIGAGVGFPPRMSSYRRNLIRLADKAVRDYMDARRYVLAQIQEQHRSPEQMAREGRVIFSFLITDRLEDCIITVSRLFRYFEMIKSDPDRFPLERLLKRRIATLENSICRVRNLIEHLDRDICSETILESETTAPVLDEKTTTIALAGVSLPVATLATAIRHFHAFAMDFAQYRRMPDGRYEHTPKSGPVTT